LLAARRGRAQLQYTQQGMSSMALS
jgi:hypothetical protein